MSKPIGIVVVGYGYWGPNIVRNVMESPEFELIALCERDAEHAARFTQRFPGVPTCADLDVLLGDPRVDAVSIATPPRTHYALAMRVLEAGKHVLVEKPLATTSHDAETLVRFAERQVRVLMPGHTFLYSPPVNKVKELIAGGELGEIYFVTSARLNLGLYQSDGVINDLAPHDISILEYWLNQPVTQVSASGRSIFQASVPETAFVTLTFGNGTAANIEVSWLAPRKVRQMIVVGSRRMVQYDDTSSDQIVRVYDRGLDRELQQPENFGEHQLIYRAGDMVAPHIPAGEPLALELLDFAAAIREGRLPRSHARLGLSVVRVMEAANASLHAGGDPVRLSANGSLVRRAPRFDRDVTLAPTRSES